MIDYHRALLLQRAIFPRSVDPISMMLLHLILDSRFVLMSVVISLLLVPATYAVVRLNRRTGEKALLLSMMVSVLPLMAAPFYPLLVYHRLLLIAAAAVRNPRFLSVLAFRMEKWMRWDPEVWLAAAAVIALVVHLAVGFSSPSGRKFMSAPAWVARYADEVSAKIGISPPQVIVLDSGIPQAYVPLALPGRKKRVVLSQGLLESLSRREVAAVMAHELAHVKHRDPLKKTVSRSLRVLGFLNPSMHLLEPWLLRDQEYAADAEAARAVGAMPLARAIAKMADSMPSLSASVGFSGKWSHGLLKLMRPYPSPADRIRALLELEEAIRP
ncbi:MAG: M48 family metallopeptidase [Thermoprotei archaeon]